MAILLRFQIIMSTSFINLVYCDYQIIKQYNHIAIQPYSHLTIYYLFCSLIIFANYVDLGKKYIIRNCGIPCKTLPVDYFTIASPFLQACTIMLTVYH